MLGQRLVISGMTIEIIADRQDQWQLRNLTTGQTLLMAKDTLDNALRLGKAEPIASDDDTD